MSITQETVKAHLKDPAIFCCRREKGLVIGPADLEDPGLFDDMVDAGLLTLSDDGLTIEQVLGKKLVEDCEALTPITASILDGVNEVVGAVQKTAAPEAEFVSKAPVAANTMVGGNGMIHVEIDKLEGLSLDIPAGVAIGGIPVAANTEATGEKKVIRTLLKQHIKITDAEIGEETAIKDGKITIAGNIVEKAVLRSIMQEHNP